MSEIRPALTPEEWAEMWTHGETAGVFIDEHGLSVSYDSNGASDGVPNRHGVAALALHGQPFGFTWEHVEAVATLATPFAGDPFMGMSEQEREATIQRLMEKASEAAERIAALLPPREGP